MVTVGASFEANSASFSVLSGPRHQRSAEVFEVALDYLS